MLPGSGGGVPGTVEAVLLAEEGGRLSVAMSLVEEDRSECWPNITCRAMREGSLNMTVL